MTARDFEGAAVREVADETELPREMTGNVLKQKGAGSTPAPGE
jgi:hypothetical protein